jgi:hypothetical protein
MTSAPDTLSRQNIHPHSQYRPYSTYHTLQQPQQHFRDDGATHDYYVFLLAFIYGIYLWVWTEFGSLSFNSFTSMNGLFHDITRRMFMVFISARIMSLLLRGILFFFLWDGPFSFLLLFESWA